MSFERLKATHEVLLRFLKENNYSRSYFFQVKAVINRIISDAEAQGWQSYHDVQHYYGAAERPKKAIQTQLSILRTIRRFDLRNEFPDNVNRSHVFDDASYLEIPGEFQEFIEFFRKSAEQCGFKEHYIHVRSLTFLTFLRAMQQRGCLRLEDITEDDVFSFFLSNNERPLRGSGIKNQLAAVLKIGLLWKEDVCSRILSFLPKLPQCRKNIQYLTENEVKQIRDALRNKENELSLRDRAIGILLLHTGLRCCDIAGLCLDSIDWERNRLRIIQQKTSVPLELPLSAVVGNALYEYITLERPDSNDVHVFLWEVDPYYPLKSGHISTITSRRIFMAANIRQQQGDHKGAHLFRHHAASHMLASGVSRPIISSALGHSSPRSVEPYLSADFKHLKECALSVELFPLSEGLPL